MAIKSTPLLEPVKKKDPPKDSALRSYFSSNARNYFL
jgi:hypothetical protein